MVIIMLNKTVAQKLIKIVAQNGVGDLQLVQISLMGFYPGFIVNWISKFVE